MTPSAKINSPPGVCLAVGIHHPAVETFLREPGKVLFSDKTIQNIGEWMGKIKELGRRWFLLC